HDQGAHAARLLHVRDRLHRGHALRRGAGTLRSVRAALAGRQDLGAARLSAARRMPGPSIFRAAVACLIALALFAAAAGPRPVAAQGEHAEDWIALFNGRDLDGWVPKIRGHELGDNYAETFRVEDGLLTVSYDGYADFGRRFGHLFHRMPFSHYRLRIEYRFVGEPAPNVEEWAYRNSGVMRHAQPPETMAGEQHVTISAALRSLAGPGDGAARPTGSMCAPGTHVVFRGRLDETHCIQGEAPTIDGDRWVTAEALVLGGERIVHLIDGEPVIEYGGIVYGGGVVSGHRPEMKPDGEPLERGYIALQSEGHPIQFRRVELLNLKGCMDPGARNYRSHYVEPDPAACAE